MRIQLQKAIASLLAVTFVVGSPAHVLAQDAPPTAPTPAPVAAPQAPAPEAGAPEMAVKEGVIAGRMLSLDGKTPIQGRTITLRNADTADVIAEVKTAEDGAFSLPPLVNGVYLVECDGVVYPVEIRDDRPLRSLKVLVPSQRTGLGAMADDTASTFIWVGAGAAVLLLAGVGGGVIGYNLRHTTGGSRGGPGFPINPLVFEISPSGDYGLVTVNTTSTRTFILRNQSTIDISGEVDSTSSAFVITSPSGDFTIAPGGVIPVVVQFAPNTPTIHVGTIEATVTDPAGLQGSVASKSVTGQGTTIAVSPASP